MAQHAAVARTVVVEVPPVAEARGAGVGGQLVADSRTALVAERQLCGGSRIARPGADVEVEDARRGVAGEQRARTGS